MNVRPTGRDRIAAYLRALIFWEFPALQFVGLYEYTITDATPTAITGQPVDTTQGLPPVTNLPLEPSVLGESVTATPGGLCLVQFVNGSPARPEVISVGPTAAAATIDATGALAIGPSASTVNLGAAQAPVARSTDTCSVYFPPGTELTIEGFTDLGPLSCTVKLVDAATQTIPMPAIGILGPGSPSVKAA